MDRMRIIVLLIVTFFYSQSIFALSSKDIGLYKSIFNDYRNGNFNKGDHIKILDKISSKNILVKLKNGEAKKHKDLLIKSMKCKNSEFDDNPEITAYIQVRDLTNKNKDDVFVFNNWMFSSSPSITPFDHPVYDLWILRCY